MGKSVRARTLASGTELTMPWERPGSHTSAQHPKCRRDAGGPRSIADPAANRHALALTPPRNIQSAGETPGETPALPGFVPQQHPSSARRGRTALRLAHMPLPPSSALHIRDQPLTPDPQPLFRPPITLAVQIIYLLNNYVVDTRVTSAYSAGGRKWSAVERQGSTGTKSHNSLFFPEFQHKNAAQPICFWEAIRPK